MPFAANRVYGTVPNCTAPIDRSSRSATNTPTQDARIWYGHHDVLLAGERCRSVRRWLSQRYCREDVSYRALMWRRLHRRETARYRRGNERGVLRDLLVVSYDHRS